MSVCIATWDYTRDVDWTFLFLATHDVESHPFCSLLQFHNPWMSLSLTSSKCCYCSLQDYFICLKGYGQTERWAETVTDKDTYIHTHSISKICEQKAHTYVHTHTTHTHTHTPLHLTTLKGSLHWSVVTTYLSSSCSSELR